MRGLGVPAVTVSLLLGLATPSSPPAGPAAPVSMLAARTPSGLTVSLISHSPVPLVVVACGALPIADGDSPSRRPTADRWKDCPVVEQTVMPGDTVGFALPLPGSGRYRLEASFAMSRDGLPPLELWAAGDTLRF